jgi:AGCS family alanine or glycine:cation symporter
VKKTVLESHITTVYAIVCGIPLVTTLVGVGVYFSIKLKFLQISRLKLALQCIGDEHETMANGGSVSNFASLCTALSATLGTGNIVGIAIAVVTGGPGAIFWIWVTSFFAMATKYAEGFLAIKYRHIDAAGKISGGPMYYLEFGAKNKMLARLFALFGIGVALVGIGTMTQAGSIAAAVHELGIPHLFTALLLAVTITAITIGGIHRIASFSEKMIPFMSSVYLGAAILVLILKADCIPYTLHLIVAGAFSPESIMGGGLGITAMTSAMVGTSRGIFSHESGIGSSAIAAAVARTNSPVKQGLVSMTGAFFSIVVCSMTGLVLIITGNDTSIFNISASEMDGAVLTSSAFGYGLGALALGKYVVIFGIVLFAFTTSIGWNYYGEKCVQYLWGTRAVVPYKIVFLFFVLIGPFLKMNIIFLLADIVIGLMAIPNLIGLVCLRKEIVDETARFFKAVK